MSQVTSNELARFAGPNQQVSKCEHALFIIRRDLTGALLVQASYNPVSSAAREPKAKGRLLQDPDMG